MHPAAFSFAAPRLIAATPKRVLEIGACDVNATMQGLSLRALLPDAVWIGIDERAGPGVDEIASAADFRTRRTFDVVISTEAMEHTPAPHDIIACAGRYLMPGGRLIITAAAPERPPHGCDGGAVQPGEHYRGIAPDELRTMLDDWADVEITHDPAVGDVYATARKTPAATD